jgi:S-adenosylmethionine/arginine decarboxylase-like enzyme
VLAVTLEQLAADLDGIPANRLADVQELAGLLLAAANAAGLNPASPPVVKIHPRGVGAVLLCHGGHVLLQAVPEAGICFVDVAGIGSVQPQRGLDVVTRRFGARQLRIDHRRRGPATQPTPSSEGA